MKTHLINEQIDEYDLIVYYWGTSYNKENVEIE